MTYKIIMMGGTEIKLDADEIPKALKAISSQQPCIVKQGIFNPSSYSCIIADTKREMTREVNEIGHYTGKTIPEPLKDIFSTVPELAQLREGSKLLSESMKMP